MISSTTDHCLTPPLPTVESRQFNRVCYFTSWSKYRKSRWAKFDIADIDPTLCTHAIYAFGQIDVDNKILMAHEPLMEEQNPKSIGRYK